MNDEYTVTDEITSDITDDIVEDQSESIVTAHDTSDNDVEVQSDTELETIASLKEEITALKTKISELETQRDTQTRILEELSDFNALFPTVEMEDIPECVWESVKKGTPLIASYALYEKRLAAEEARIAKINAANALRSPGIAGKDTASEYFTPDEVKKMSRSEVHANYSKIKESMKKWMEK